MSNRTPFLFLNLGRRHSSLTNRIPETADRENDHNIFNQTKKKTIWTLSSSSSPETHREQRLHSFIHFVFSFLLLKTYLKNKKNSRKKKPHVSQLGQIVASNYRNIPKNKNKKNLKKKNFSFYWNYCNFLSSNNRFCFKQKQTKKKKKERLWWPGGPTSSSVTLWLGRRRWSPACPLLLVCAC